MKAVTLITSGILLSTIVIGAASYISAYNYGNSAETSIKATWENNQNILAQYTQKVQEAAQVPTMMKDDLKEVIKEALTSRYGSEGSKATFQWLKEQNPNIDAQLYRKIQQIIEAGRDEFKNSQTRLIDEKRSYQTNLGYFWKGFWMRIAGYPRINLDDYKAIINDYAADAFKTGKENSPIKLR